MASDYKKIAEDHEKRYGWDAKPRRIYKRLYSDKTHFIYELIQNADDSGSENLELHLHENELVVWNDGRQFNEKDVRSICSLGSSDKDLTDIGTFGIGFKAVYNYTDFPEIYSGNEHFRIRDFVKPEGIDEMTSEIEELVKVGKTVFCLPFKGRRHQVNDIGHLKDRLCNLSKERSVLFLRNLTRVEWKDRRNAQRGSYACHRHPYDKNQNVSENESVELVNLTASLDGSDKSSEAFLVFCREVHPPKAVIDKLLEQAEDEEDEEEQQRIQQSEGKSQPIEIAFKLQDDRITAMDDNCVLFAYLPTQKETHLRFLIQARYQTTPARDNIPKPSENPWNKWLVQETSDYLPEVLEQLKVAGLLEPAFFNVLPLKGKVGDEFKPIAEALQKAMQERALVPTQSGGYAKAESVFHVNSKGVAIPRGIEYRYAKAQNVYYPHAEILRQLIENNGFHPESNWLHPEIRNTEEFRQCFKVMQEADVKPVGISRVLGWLETRDANWFKGRSNKWLCFLYTYLKEQGTQLDRIKKLPLIRLENGRHVCASNELVFFPPDTDEEHEEIAPFLNELPILQPALLEGENHTDVKSFLRDLGVEVLRPENLINKSVFPLYRKLDKPSVMENRLHVRYIFKVWDKLSGYERRNLKKEISETPILWAYKGDQPENFDFVKPCEAYLPETYTGDADLETYFSVYNGDIWFVDRAYMEVDSNRKDWLQFLKAIGSIDTPQVDKIEVTGNYEECNKRGITRQDSTRPFEDGEFKNGYRTAYQYFDGYIVDPCLVGLSQLLAQIKKRNGVNLSCSVWSLLIKTIKPLSPEKQRRQKASSRDAFFQCTYHWYYHKPQHESFEANFYRQLKKTTWLPDEQDKLRQPSDLFAPTDENRKVLGNSVAYLHPDFDISTQPAQWLAKKLEISLNAGTNSVLNHLRTLSGTEASVKDVEPLYRFLNRQDASRSEEFKKSRLIFTPNPESRWWRVDEVFWEDKSEVLENDRRCLKAHYPAILKSFFINLGVSEQASQQDYAYRIQEIATTEQAADKKVRERLRRLYKCLITWQKNEWEIIYDDRCWFGKEGKEWGFFTRQELVLKDHPHIGEIFEGKVPFWTLDDDLSSLASILKIDECSQAQVEFHSEGDQGENTDWSEKVQKLRPYIYAFLNSPRLSEEPEKEELAEVLDQLSVCRVKELRVTYKLKGISVPDPNPRPSFLDVTDQQVILWLGPEANEDEYAELIGDALQEHFDIKELGRFVEDLLTPTKKRDRVLSNWKRKGLDTKFLNEYPKSDKEEKTESLDEKLRDVPNSGDADPASDESNMKIPTDSEIPKTDSEDNESLTDKAGESETHLFGSEDDNSGTDEYEIEMSVDSEEAEIDKSDDGSTSDESESPTNSVSDIRSIGSPDTQSSTKTRSGTTQNINGESESEMSTVHEDPDTGNENDDSTENESETTTYQPRPGRSRTRPRRGKVLNTHSENRGTGSSDSSGETDTSSHDRKEIERIGMEHARRYEEEQGCTVEDVSTENLGFDLRSTTPEGEIRCIEVKARAERALVVLTSNEWDTAEQLKDNYFLYVVLNAKTQPERYIIQNPTDKVAVDERYDVRYQVPLSEIKEHGIPV